MKPSAILSKISETEIARVCSFGTGEELLARFNPDAKNKAILHEEKMITPGCSPRLCHVAAAHDMLTAQTFLMIQCAATLKLLGLQFAADEKTVLRSLAAAMYAQHSNLMLTEWLLFFSYAENFSNLPVIYSQSKFMSLLNQWVTERNQKLHNIIQRQKTENNLNSENTITYDEYLKGLSTEDRGKSSLSKIKE